MKRVMYWTSGDGVGDIVTVGVYEENSPLYLPYVEFLERFEREEYVVSDHLWSSFIPGVDHIGWLHDDATWKLKKI